jgi:hypothetical protein
MDEKQSTDNAPETAADPEAPTQRYPEPTATEPVSDKPGPAHFLDKQITMHRADAQPYNRNQTVILKHQARHQAKHAMEDGRIPSGYVLQTSDGKQYSDEDELFLHVKHGDTVQVVKAEPMAAAD